MRRPRGGRARFLLFVLTIAVGLQVPLLWALGRLTGHPGVAVVVAALLTGGFLSGLLDRASFGAPGRARLYLVLWPFFVTWTGAMFFAFLLPLALGVAALLGAATNLAFAATLGAAMLLTA
ncbi:MAG TPA: hypothetical protein VMT47_04335, partial [Polyangia bacterium]|nr:hypothetical protein [Polyangia bacterium]